MGARYLAKRLIRKSTRSDSDDPLPSIREWITVPCMERTPLPARDNPVLKLPKLEALLAKLIDHEPGEPISDERAARVLGWSYGSAYRIRRGKQQPGMALVREFRRRFPDEPVDTISPDLARELAVLAATA